MSIATTARTSLFPNGRPSAVTESLLRVRARTDPDRELPDFLIIEAQRCGTSSFYKYLEDHPLIVPSLRKEVRYFDRNYAKGEGWYRRNPVDRALSHYHHSVRHGWETLSFEEALEAEPERLAHHAERLVSDPTYHSRDYLRFSYTERGHYAEQLERWIAVFPRDRILVLCSEDLFHHPAAKYHRLLEFLGLPAWTPADSPTTATGGDQARRPRHVTRCPSTARRSIRPQQPATGAAHGSFVRLGLVSGS